MMRTLAVLLILIGAIAPRIAATEHQCYAPAFTYSAACFAHDVITGEDL